MVAGGQRIQTVPERGWWRRCMRWLTKIPSQSAPSVGLPAGACFHEHASREFCLPGAFGYRPAAKKPARAAAWASRCSTAGRRCDKENYRSPRQPPGTSSCRSRAPRQRSARPPKGAAERRTPRRDRRAVARRPLQRNRGSAPRAPRSADAARSPAARARQGASVCGKRRPGAGDFPGSTQGASSKELKISGERARLALEFTAQAARPNVLDVGMNVHHRAVALANHSERLDDVIETATSGRRTASLRRTA